jgi:hypothetical protein
MVHPRPDTSLDGLPDCIVRLADVTQHGQLRAIQDSVAVANPSIIVSFLLCLLDLLLILLSCLGGFLTITAGSVRVRSFALGSLIVVASFFQRLALRRRYVVVVLESLRVRVRWWCAVAMVAWVCRRSGVAACWRRCVVVFYATSVELVHDAEESRS